MMNELLRTMSLDMRIDRFLDETEESFAYRVVYSALGQWCLRTAQNNTTGVSGTTKHNQTIVLNDLLDKYMKVFPSVADKFTDTGSQHTSFSVFIRRVYEETGYLLTNVDNRNEIANYGRSILVGEKALFFGLPNGDYTVNGLGVFAAPTSYGVSSKEFLMRDDLTYKEYFKASFDSIDFYDREIDLSELEFFNPLSRNVPSRSWEKHPQTECTLARKTELGPFYKVIRISDSLQFADDPIEPQSDSFTSYEYRRLYFALKAYYGMPLKASITKMDENYSAIMVGGHLPNREYYYLLLLSWPMRSAFDKISFLAHNNVVKEIVNILENLGIEIEGGVTNNG